MSDPAPAPRPPRPLDEEGLPVDRLPTLNDVRGGEKHYLLAAFCSVAVVAVVLVFWVLRMLLAH